MSDSAQKEYLDQLVAHRLLVPSGVPGVYGRGFHFEDTIERLGRAITKLGAAERPEVVRFPPVMSRASFEKTEYLKSMPQLAGSVFSFTGDGAAHARLLGLVEGGADWSGTQSMTDVALVPAACYPVYPMVAADGPLAEGGRLFDVLTYCFRHEPSGDPARMQSFRQREYVRVAATEDQVRAWRDDWLGRGLGFVAALGLEGRAVPANDPFFGRAGRMLAANQLESELKMEIVYPITSEEKPTAIVSVNIHQDLFGRVFGIRTASGQPANTGCIGFGLERITLALFKTHGFDPAGWPAAVREVLAA
jgi:seryl-tRNA synthetase